MCLSIDCLIGQVPEHSWAQAWVIDYWTPDGSSAKCKMPKHLSPKCQEQSIRALRTRVIEYLRLEHSSIEESSVRSPRVLRSSSTQKLKIWELEPECSITEWPEKPRTWKLESKYMRVQRIEIVITNGYKRRCAPQ